MTTAAIATTAVAATATAAVTDPPPPLTAALAEGLTALAAPHSRGTIDTLGRYLMLLAHWNRRINLSGVRSPLVMVTRHILDSLAVRPYLHGERILDVGSGAGFPGAPLAMVYPELRVTLVESRTRKAQFLHHVIGALSLHGNLQAQCCRVEQYQPAQPFDTLIARAFGGAAAVIRAAAHLRHAAGRIIVMKGAYPGAEMVALAGSGWHAEVRPYRVPGLDAQRHLLLLTPR